MSPHRHRYGIADNEAVNVLVNKALAAGPQRVSREKLLKALKRASRRYIDSRRKEDQAFFHGLLTGYAVGLKLP
jgi:hypothetical protein